MVDQREKGKRSVDLLERLGLSEDMCECKVLQEEMLVNWVYSIFHEAEMKEFPRIVRNKGGTIRYFHA